MIKRQRNAQLLCAVIIAVLGVVTLIQAKKIPKAFGTDMQPNVFPNIVGWSLIVLAVLLVVESFYRYRNSDPEINWPDKQGKISWAICMAAMIVYVIGIEPVGFLAITFLFMVFCIKFFGKQYSWLFSIAVSLITCVVIYYFFVKLLQLPLPMGILGMLK